MPWFNKKVIKIDVKKIDQYEDETKQLIADFLAQRQQQKKKDERTPKYRIKKNKPYKVGKDKSGKDVYLQFNCSLIKFERDDPTKGFTFKTLDGKILGAGSYGTVQKSNIGISINQGTRALQIKHKHQVIKKQAIRSNADIKDVIKEANNNNTIFPSGAKKGCAFTKDDSGHYCGYSTMPKIEGTTLESYLKNKTIAPNEAIDIWLKIIYNKKAGTLKIIDWGLSRSYGTKPLGGTEEYTPQQSNNERASNKYDIPSIAIIILRDIFPACGRNIDIGYLKSNYGIDLQEMLTNMKSPNPDQRPSLDELKTFLENAKIQAKAFLIQRVKQYRNDKANDPRGDYHHNAFSFFHYFQHDRTTKLEAVNMLLHALENNEPVLKLTPKHYDAITQGELKKIFDDVLRYGILKVEKLPKEEFQFEFTYKGQPCSCRLPYKYPQTYEALKANLDVIAGELAKKGVCRKGIDTITLTLNDRLFEYNQGNGEIIVDGVKVDKACSSPCEALHQHTI